MKLRRAIHRTTAIAGAVAMLSSLLLHLVVVFCLFRSWDAVAAITVFPVWIWAILGVGLAGLGYLLTGSKLTGIPIIVWLVTVFLGADERKSLMRGLTPTLHSERAPAGDGALQLRIATINCKERNIDAVREVARFQPDIVFVQEAPFHRQLDELAKEMWGESGSATGTHHCAILADGKLTRRRNVLYENGAGAMLTLEDGTEIELLSVHLAHAITRADLWNPSAWKAHAKRHRERGEQLGKLLGAFQVDAAGRPMLWGGDFNAPPTSNLFNDIPDRFTNAFGAAGRGLGNTFINGFPLLRIDHLYAGPRFEIVDARSARTEHSDHRMVVADVSLDPGSVEPVPGAGDGGE